MKFAYPIGALAVSFVGYAYVANSHYDNHIEESVQAVVSEMAPGGSNPIAWDSETETMRIEDWMITVVDTDPPYDWTPEQKLRWRNDPEQQRDLEKRVREHDAHIAKLRQVLPEANREGKRRALANAAFSGEALAVPVIGFIILGAMWLSTKRKKKHVRRRKQYPETELGLDDLTNTLAKRAARDLASSDTFQTKAGPVIVSWALAPDPVNAIRSVLGGDVTVLDIQRNDVEKAAVRAKIRELLAISQDPKTDLSEHADVLGIVVLSMSGQAATKRAGLAALLAETDDPDEAEIIFEKYKKDRGIQPGSDREVRANAIFSEYIGRLLDPDSE
jgi:hypothetical protein